MILVFFFFRVKKHFLSNHLKWIDKRKKSNFGFNVINQFDEWKHYFDGEQESNHSLNDSSSVFIMSTI